MSNDYEWSLEDQMTLKSIPYGAFRDFFLDNLAAWYSVKALVELELEAERDRIDQAQTGSASREEASTPHPKRDAS